MKKPHRTSLSRTENISHRGSGVVISYGWLACSRNLIGILSPLLSPSSCLSLFIGITARNGLNRLHGSGWRVAGQRDART